MRSWSFEIDSEAFGNGYTNHRFVQLDSWITQAVEAKDTMVFPLECVAINSELEGKNSTKSYDHPSDLSCISNLH